MTNLEPTFKLEFPLLPKKGPVRRTDIEKAFLVEPMIKIPASLVPSSSRSKSRPPRLHYGWVLDDPDRLVRFAKEKGITPKSAYRDEDFGNSDEDEDEDDVIAQYEDKEEAAKFAVSEHTLKIEALVAIAKDLDFERVPYLTEVFCPGKGKGMVEMIAVIENYTLREGFINREDLRKLQEYFDLEGRPMWYLDTILWRWNKERF